jgi:hypothetical protein
LFVVASGTEVWCGQGHGKIIIWNVDSTGGGLHSLYHHETNSQATAAAADVIRLVSGHGACSPTVWSYVYPGMLHCYIHIIMKYRSVAAYSEAVK